MEQTRTSCVSDWILESMVYPIYFVRFFEYPESRSHVGRKGINITSHHDLLFPYETNFTLSYYMLFKNQYCTKILGQMPLNRTSLTFTSRGDALERVAAVLAKYRHDDY